MLKLGPHPQGLNTFCLAFSPRGGLLASGGHDGSVRLWDLATQAEVWQRSLTKGDTNSLAFSRDGSLLVVPSNRKPSVLNVLDAGGEVLATPTMKGVCHCALFSADPEVLIHTGYDMSPTGRSAIHLTKWRDGTEVAALHGHEEQVGFLALSPDGTLLASGAADQTVRLWSLAERKQLGLRHHRTRVWAVVFGPDGKTLATSGGKDVELWAVGEGMARMHTLRGHTGCVYGVAYTPDGSCLVSGGEDGVVRVWDVASGQQVGAIEPGLGKLDNVTVAPDGWMVAVSNKEGELVVFDLEGG